MNPACKLYLTYRSEYLVLRDLCVGVRDRASGVWVPLHAATCAHLLGPLSAREPGGPAVPTATLPRVGERMTLYATARRIVSGPVVAIEPAPAALVAEADRRWQALFEARDPRHSSIVLA